LKENLNLVHSQEPGKKIFGLMCNRRAGCIITPGRLASRSVNS
jgi:hypothetical protein